ncbi:hypothetical protein AVEN_248007-1 [Araneus ventricosus]|uniref:Uncharacterized protein n=1 Tax=Araneus ventricosus TaxID=182803 RepID=A0A4Y2JEJ3_ARAVE|nr:hypothetical protein AVEN_248007-1 [Araneus ventricosus]
MSPHRRKSKPACHTAHGRSGIRELNPDSIRRPQGTLSCHAIRQTTLPCLPISVKTEENGRRDQKVSLSSVRHFCDRSVEFLADLKSFIDIWDDVTTQKGGRRMPFPHVTPLHEAHWQRLEIVLRATEPSAAASDKRTDNLRDWFLWSPSWKIRVEIMCVY